MLMIRITANRGEDTDETANAILQERLFEMIQLFEHEIGCDVEVSRPEII